MRISIKEVLKFSTVFPAVALNYLDRLLYLFTGKDFGKSKEFRDLFFGTMYGITYKKDDGRVSHTMSSLAIPVIFSILYGSYIYNKLHVSNIYMFTREKSRVKWYAGKLFQLIVITALYCSVWVGFCLFYTYKINPGCLGTFEYKCVLLSYVTVTEYTIIITLMVNLFALFLGTAIGFIITYAITIILMLLTYYVQTINIGSLKIDFTKFNIFDNTILSWGNKFDYSCILVNGAYILILAAAIGIVVRYMDIGLKDKELM